MNICRLTRFSLRFAMKTWNSSLDRLFTRPHAVMEHRRSTRLLPISIFMSPAPCILTISVACKCVRIVILTRNTTLPKLIPWSVVVWVRFHIEHWIIGVFESIAIFVVIVVICFKRYGTIIRSIGIILRMHRSINEILINTSTPRLMTIPEPVVGA